MDNILVIRNDRFGEFLLIIPAVRALKESFPQAKVTLVVNSQVLGLAKFIGYADEVIAWDDRPHSLLEIMKFAGKLAKKKFDLSVVFNPRKDSHILTFLAGVPKRVGYRRKWGALLTDSIEDIKHLGKKHEVDYNLDLVGLVGAKTRDKSLALSSVPQEKRKDYAGSVAIHPFTSDARKQWPVERFRELAERIAVDLGCKVVVVGQGEESSIGKGREKIIDLVNKTSLVDLAVILKSARLLISGDSGPVHLACTVGTPVIAIFRNDMPGKTAKRWGPWQKGELVVEARDLAQISVGDVFNIARQELMR